MNNGKKRRSIWTVEYTEYLLEVWHEYSNQLRGTKHNGGIYSRMASELEKKGVQITAKELRHKINNMTQRYREETKALVPGSSPSQWKFYENVHKVIGGYASNNLSNIDESDAIDNTGSLPSSEDTISFKFFGKDVQPLLNEPENPTSIREDDDSSRLSAGTSIITARTREETFSRKRKLLFEEEVLQEIKKCNIILEKEFSAYRKLTEDSIRTDKEFQTQVIKFQNDFLEILRNNK